MLFRSDLEGIGSTRKNADGTLGEYFTKSTKFDSEVTAQGKLPINWEHGKRARVDGLGKADILGYVDWSTAKSDERGLWVERVLNRANKYVQWIYELIKAGRIGSSSEASPVQKSANGEIVVYPLTGDALTVEPMEPRMITANVMTALKALGFEIEDDDDDSPEGKATGESKAKSETIAPVIPPTTPNQKGTNEDRKSVV